MTADFCSALAWSQRVIWLMLGAMIVTVAVIADEWRRRRRAGARRAMCSGATASPPVRAAPPTTTAQEPLEARCVTLVGGALLRAALAGDGAPPALLRQVVAEHWGARPGDPRAWLDGWWRTSSPVLGDEPAAAWVGGLTGLTLTLRAVLDALPSDEQPPV